MVIEEREQLQVALEEAGQRFMQMEQRCAHHAAEAQRAIRELELQRRLCSSEHRSFASGQTSSPNSTAQSQRAQHDSANSSCASSNGQPASLFAELMSCDLDELPVTCTPALHKENMMQLNELSSDGDEIECDINTEDGSDYRVSTIIY